MAISKYDYDEARREHEMREFQYRMKQDMLREMDRYAQQVNVISSPYQNAFGKVTSLNGGMNQLSQMQMAAAQVESKTPNDPLGFMKLADSNKLLLTGVKP
jgi:hypothetical protein